MASSYQLRLLGLFVFPAIENAALGEIICEHVPNEMCTFVAVRRSTSARPRRWWREGYQGGTLRATRASVIAGSPGGQWGSRRTCSSSLRSWPSFAPRLATTTCIGLSAGTHRAMMELASSGHALSSSSSYSLRK
ncbi:hypothetical protein MLD38_022610 [Melastoma candidum]|uniref:Uncharacterized protein n=1 Tax=Melastoma candidum TaxID=119954 RepID=A0ACB9QNR9_9MYRT|nr:hypothetical protein MLD38_022610 [Melastoma candidum]